MLTIRSLNILLLAVDSSTSTGPCCHFNCVDCLFSQSTECDHSSTGVSRGKPECLVTSFLPIPHPIACYLSILIPAVHWPPSDADTRRTDHWQPHRRGRGRWNCEWETFRMREEALKGRLTSSSCCGCDSILFSPSSSQSDNEHDRIFSSLPQASECIWCTTSSYITSGVSETASVSVGVGDGVASSCWSPLQCPWYGQRCIGCGENSCTKSVCWEEKILAIYDRAHRHTMYV